MAKQVKKGELLRPNPPHQKTSIGRSPNTAPKNKAKKRSFKKYRGQGV